MKNGLAGFAKVIAASMVMAAGISVGAQGADFSSIGQSDSISAKSNQKSNIDLGVAAYRAGEYDVSWRLLQPVAAKGETKAQRYLGYIILDGKAPSGKSDLFSGVALLKKAALAGDYVALVRLEQLRRSGLAHAPSLEDMIDIEIARAENGDPVAAWRLAKRYDLGDGVSVSHEDRVKWLSVAADADEDRFPKAGEASFQLCQIYALNDRDRDADAARHWCANAVNRGHTGAVIVLKRLAQLSN